MGTWTWVNTFGVAVAVAAIGAVGWFVDDARWAWLAVMVIVAALLVVVGLGINGRPAGAWIDERNKMTLSRLQMIAWTVLVLSAFLVIGLHNLRSNLAEPLRVSIPGVVWLAMGISTVSLVGSPLILSTKKRRTPNADETQRTVSELEGGSVSLQPAGSRMLMQVGDGATRSVRAIGQVEVRASSDDASWADLFRGDETGNAAYVDLGKVQMLLITAILLLAYGLAIYTLFTGNTRVDALPTLDDSMLALLAISHAGYLSTKAVSHSAPE